MKSFRRSYTDFTNDAGSIIGGIESAEYVSKVEEAIDMAVHALRGEAARRTNVSEDYLKGWLAEQWHAETLKISGLARSRTDVWAKVVGNNRPGEDVYYGDAQASKIAEIKYYKFADDTAKAISRPEYEGCAKIVPGDQRDSVSSVAEKLAHKNQESRPEQAAQYDDTSRTAADHLRVGPASSKPLDHADAKSMANEFKRDGDINPNKYDLNVEGFIEWADVVRQSGEAALHAAALSAALSAAPHIWRTVAEYIDSGDLDPGLLAQSGQSVLFAASSAGLRGGVAAGLTVACKSGALGSALKGISPFAIGMATTMALNAMCYSLEMQQGKITRQEFAHRCLRDTFVLSTGFTAAVIGQCIIPIPVFGALAGNLVGSTLGAVAFEAANNVTLGLCAESGWTFFGLVNQDYVVPEHILRMYGESLFNIGTFCIQTFSNVSFGVGDFKTNYLSFQPLRRGVISCDTIGYT